MRGARYADRLRNEGEDLMDDSAVGGGLVHIVQASGEILEGKASLLQAVLSAVSSRSRTRLACVCASL